MKLIQLSYNKFIKEVEAVARVAVNPEVIRWAVQRSEVPETIEKKFPKLVEWMKNETKPTLKQLEQLARATSTPLGFFFLSEPPEIKLSIPHFRTLDDTYATDNREKRNKIPIPNACRAFGIQYVNTFEMLRKLNATLGD